jgi:type IV pilus assembly PilX-like protein
MRKQSDVTSGGRPGESGFALILAILALMLLTFLGLTLAATTSTELQIATNYRWSQQALYNAEAGLEASKIVLSRVASTSTYWDAILGPPRTVPWTGVPAPPGGGVGRDYLHAACPGDRGGVGYGKVLVEGPTRYEDQSNFMGQPINGAFTVWIRRALAIDNKGLYTDDPDSSAVIVTAEGVAPFTTGAAGSAFVRANQAVRLLEVRFNLELSQKGSACNDRQSAQVGQGPSGDNFNPCAILSPNGSSLANAFGAAGTGVSGGLGSTGVQ